MGKRFVVLGNGIAGFSAAEAIRKQQEDGEIMMISEEREGAYIRPLLGRTDILFLPERPPLLADEAWYSQNRIRQVTGEKVIKLRPEEKEILLDGGRKLEYDVGIYALGARNIIPDIPGLKEAGAVSVRTWEDMVLLKKRLARAQTAAVIGADPQGLMIAWSIRRAGLKVTVFEPEEWFLKPFLDRESADIFRALAEEAGVQVITQSRIKMVRPERKERAVILEDGREVPADLVVTSWGRQANIEPAEAGGILCGKGVLADRFLQTSQPCLFAAGDCIRQAGPNPGTWLFGKQSGETAGYNGALFLKGRQKLRAFCPAPEPLLLHVFGTGLFAMGDLSGEGKVQPQEEEKKGFLVNKRTGAVRYKKYFYREHGLAGAVLIGDLSDAGRVREALLTFPANQKEG